MINLRGRSHRGRCVYIASLSCHLWLLLRYLIIDTWLLRDHLCLKDHWLHRVLPMKLRLELGSVQENEAGLLLLLLQGLQLSCLLQHVLRERLSCWCEDCLRGGVSENLLVSNVSWRGWSLSLLNNLVKIRLLILQCSGRDRLGLQDLGCAAEDWLGIELSHHLSSFLGLLLFGNCLLQGL